MLDLGALEKAQAAINPVGHASVEQRCFHHPALRIAAVQQRNFLALGALTHQLAHFIDKPLCLGKVADGLDHPHRLARAGLGAQVFAQPLAVVADQLIGRIQNVAETAVVALELDLVRDVEFAHKVSHVAHACAAKRVNALVVVTDRHHRAALHHASALRRIRALPGQHLDPGVLQLVGVLELVDQDVAKAPLVVFAYRGIVTQQLVAAQHQLAKIDHAFALALVFVQGVDLGLLAGFLVAHHHIPGAQAVFLAAGDKPHQLLGWETLFINIELPAKPLDGRELVLRIEDLECRRQIGQLVMRPQKAVAQAMKSANPHAAHVERQHG